jgi:1-acyl-sn-glycerol-3-phosphate acyltransferase
MRAMWRICALMGSLAWYLGRLMLLSWIFGETESRGFRYRRKYTKVAMRILGVRLTVHGHPTSTPALYPSNHRSLLDPIIQLHFIDAYVVAKSEVSGYPLVGRGAHETGVVFVKRESNKSRLASREAIRELLQQGKSVFIYPEGTTSNVPTTQPFKIGSFQIAAELNVPVIPVAIDYADPENYWQDMSTLPFFMRKFSKKHIVATLSIGTPLQGDDPAILMTQAREWIGREIVRM